MLRNVSLLLLLAAASQLLTFFIMTVTGLAYRPASMVMFFLLFLLTALSFLGLHILKRRNHRTQAKVVAATKNAKNQIFDQPETLRSFREAANRLEDSVEKTTVLEQLTIIEKERKTASTNLPPGHRG